VLFLDWGLESAPGLGNTGCHAIATLALDPFILHCGFLPFHHRLLLLRLTRDSTMAMASAASASAASAATSTTSHRRNLQAAVGVPGPASRRRAPTHRAASAALGPAPGRLDEDAARDRVMRLAEGTAQGRGALEAVQGVIQTDSRRLMLFR